jgi:alpha-beta hydrolase superfamily lysophospholipase
MDETTLRFTSEAGDGAEITAYRWSGDGDPRAIVVVAHGMGEHAGRYRRLAEALVDAGYVVYAPDHRGHGRTAGSADAHGNLGASGWDALVGDLGTLVGVARAEHPGIPLVAFGHSMGSFALQQYLLDHSADVEAAVLSGTTALDVVAPAIDPTKEVDLSAFNLAFAPARTDYDWLSRDEAEVDAYVDDPDCGFGLDPAATAGMLARAGDTADVSAVRADLPIYLMSGDADPLAGGGPLVDLVADRYREAGVRDVTVVLYPQARHEILNETNRDEVTADLLSWLDRVTAA